MQARQRTHVPAQHSPDQNPRSPLRWTSQAPLAPGAGGRLPSLRRRGGVLACLLFALTVLLFGLCDPCRAQSSWSKLPTARERAEGKAGEAAAERTTATTTPAPREEQTLLGTIRDAKGAPLRGVRVSIFVDGRVAAQGVTDPQGGYVLALSFDPTEDPTIVAVYTPSQTELASEYLLLRETEAAAALWGPCVPRAAFGSRHSGESPRDGDVGGDGATIYDLTMISGWDRRAAQLESDCWREDAREPSAGGTRSE